MSHELSQIFKNIAQIEPPERLESLILSRTESIKMARERRKMRLSSLGLVFSGISIAIAIIFFGKNIINSEFWTIFSLIFSDAMVIAGNFREFLYSLLETLPVIHMIAILIPVFSLLLFFNFYLSFKNKIKNIHNSRQLKFV